MSRRKVKKWRPKAGRQAQRSARSDSVVAIDADQMGKRERYFELFLMATLLAFGVYQSVLYFGHTVVPISDFPSIVKVGHDLLSFRLPVRFKQAPVVGLLQALLSHVVGGQHPDLTAGWLLNAILHPLNLVLFYLVAKHVVGRAAVWFAIIAALNHWVIYMLTEPIMETTLLFFLLLTFYLIFSRSKWCYVAASITTMVRYEGAALIVAAFVMDMIHYKSKQERIRAFLYSVMAAIPLALWMLGTIINWQSEGSHYLSVLFSKEYSKAFAEPVENRTGILRHMNLLWSVGFRPLLSAGRDSAAGLAKLTKSAAVLTFFFGSIYGMLKRRWKILTLLIFFVPYFLLHAAYPYPLQRFHTTIFWIAVLICLFGMQSIWSLADGRGRIPGSLVLTLQILAAAAAIIWFVRLIPDLSVLAKISPKSASLPWLAMMLVGLISAGRAYICGRRCLLRQFSILAVMCLAILSNQFTVAPLLGDGQREKEFKQLADWYIANARPGEKLGVYMASVVQIFAPKYAEYIVRLPQAEAPAKFVNACYEQNITYVVWATREGMTTDHTGYRQIGLHKNIAHLREPKNIGPYQFVAQVGWERGYVNIFRLLKPPSLQNRESPGS